MSQSAQFDFGEEILPERFILKKTCGNRSFNERWSQSVNPDILWAKFNRQCLGKTLNCKLTGAVNRSVSCANVPYLRRNVYDRSLDAVSQHVSHCMLSHKIQALHIKVHDSVKIFFFNIMKWLGSVCARVIDQHVKCAFANRAMLNGADVSHIKSDVVSFTTIFGNRGNGRLKFSLISALLNKSNFC